jgi:WD40 repeat protein
VGGSSIKGKNDLKRQLLQLFSLLLVCLASCQPALSQPVFTPSAKTTTTPIPLPLDLRVKTAALPGVIWSFDMNPLDSTIAFATSKGVLLYDMDTFEYLRTLDEGKNTFSLAWSQDGKRLAVGVINEYQDHGEAGLVIWDTTEWKIIPLPKFQIDLTNERILDIAWQPDSRRLALSTDFKGVFVLDAETGKVLSQQAEFAASVTDIDWSPDGSRLIANNDMAYGIRRWVAAENDPVRLFDQRAGNAMHLAWSPDGSRIVSGHSNGVVCFWTAATNRCDGLIQAHRSGVFGLDWSPDGKMLATSGGVIRLWDTQTGELLTSFGEDPEIIYTQLQWLPASNLLVTLQTNLEDQEITSVRIWDPSSGVPINEIRGGKR